MSLKDEKNLNDLPPPSTPLSTRPKAESAPATPCNTTPTAVDQHHLSSNYTNSFISSSKSNPANTLPLDIRRNISATCRKLPSSIGYNGQLTASTSIDANTYTNSNSTNSRISNNHLGLSKISSRTTLNLHHMDELIKRGDSLLNSKDYEKAIYFYTQWIDLAEESQNGLVHLEELFRVYDQRAEAYFRLGQYEASIKDSIEARDKNPNWTQAYYRQGMAQFLLKNYLDSLAAFAFGLSLDSNNSLLFQSLVNAALDCNLFKEDFELKYNTLKSLHLDKDPFIVVSILGQDVLAKGHSNHAIIILESALKIGTDKRRLMSSVFSTISYAYCMRKEYDKAIINMEKELEIEDEALDIIGQCRVLGNLGYTYYKMRKFDKSLEAHRKQVNKAMRARLFPQASLALNAIGHIHVARNDFTNALTSHSKCLEILKQLDDNNFNQFKEILSIGYIHSMLGDFESTDKKYKEAEEFLELSKLRNKIRPEDHLIGLVMVNFNRAYLALKNQSFYDAERYYSKVIELAQSFQDRRGILFEMRASNGLGQTYKLNKEFERAKIWFDKQLKLARSSKDLVGQSQALCNLGMIHQHYKEYDLAKNKFEENLRLVDEDPLLKAYAHSYLGSMFFLFNKYNDAQAQYEISLKLFKELDYCMAEKKTIDLNMAAIHERMGNSELSLSSIAHQRQLMLA